MVTVQVDAPGLSEDSTPVPVEIVGANASGETVSEYQFVKPGAMGVELLPGSYDLTFKVGYATSDAHIAIPAKYTVHVEIGLFEGTEKVLSESVAYKLKEDDVVTSEQFSRIIECAKQNPDDGGRAAQLCKKAEEHGAFMKEAKKNFEGFLQSIHDNKHNAEKNRKMSQYVTEGKYIQAMSAICEIDSIEVTMMFDDTVTYKVSYNGVGPYNIAFSEDEEGHLGIAPDGKVNAWYIEGYPSSWLYDK